MKLISKENTMGEVLNHSELKKLSKYLMFTNDIDNVPDVNNIPLKSVTDAGWSVDGIVNGVNFLLNEIENGRQKQYFIYSADEIKEQPAKADVNVIHLLPENVDEKKPYIVLCAGGAYMAVCTMVESLPTAKHFVEAGYQVFLLTYRVGGIGATPKAIDDLGATMQWLENHAKELSVPKGKYAIGGFSAGANLISNWGVPELGYEKYNVLKPICMFPIYTFIDLKTESKKDKNGGLLVPMLGHDYMNRIDEYNIIDHIDNRYPPCYIVCGLADELVPPENSKMLKKLLDEAGVAALLQIGEHAPHGFGDGTGTEVEGWPEKAIKFLEAR